MNFFKNNWLYLLVAALPFERIPSLDIPLGGHSVTIRLSQIIAILIILLYFFNRSFWRKIRSVIWPNNPIFWLLVYLAVALASIPGSIDKTRSVEVFAASLLVISTAIAVTLTAKTQQLRRIYRVMAITALAVCIFGLYQFIGDSLGLSQAITGLRDNYIKEVFSFPRVQSVGLEPLFFANYLILPLVATIALYITSAFRKNTALILAFIISLTLFLTLSRGGMIASGLGIVLITALLWRNINPKRYALTILSIILAATTAVGAIYLVGDNSGAGQGGAAVSKYKHQAESLKPSAYTADNDRTRTKKLAFDDFKSHPLLGSGIGSFGTYAKQADPVDYPASGISPTVNNEYYEIAAETGLLGIAALGIFLLTLLYHFIIRFHGSTSSHRVWLAVLGASLAAYLVQYLAFSTLYIMNIWVTLGLLMSLLNLRLQNDAELKKQC